MPLVFLLEPYVHQFLAPVVAVLRLEVPDAPVQVFKTPALLDAGGDFGADLEVMSTARAVVASDGTNLPGVDEGLGVRKVVKSVENTLSKGGGVVRIWVACGDGGQQRLKLDTSTDQRLNVENVEHERR